MYFLNDLLFMALLFEESFEQLIMIRFNNIHCVDKVKVLPHSALDSMGVWCIIG